VPLTTEAAVRRIIKTALTSEQVQTFIDDAELWVGEELDANTNTTARLEVITRYLACALIRTRDLGLSSATFKDVSEQYQVDPEVTDYLKRAASFDGSGKVRQHFLGDGPGMKAVSFRVGDGFGVQASA
jgi:hypothetical protein